MDADRPKAIEAPPGMPPLMDAPKAKASTSNKRTAPEPFRGTKRNSINSTGTSWSDLHQGTRSGDPHISRAVPDSSSKYVQNNVKIDMEIPWSGGKKGGILDV